MMGSNFNDEIECGSFFDNIDDLIECPSDNDIDFISGNSNDFQSILTSNVEELPVNDISYNSGNCNDFQSILTNNVEELPHNDMSYNSGDGNDFQSIWANNDDVLPAPEPMCSDLSAELAVPYEDIKHLEWLSNFMEESFTGGGMTVNIENVPVDNKPSQNQFRTSSPISVLDSSSSSSSSEGKTSPPSPSHLGLQRGTRSKRPRPANFNPRTAMQFMTPSPCVTDNRQQVDVPVISAESMNFADSHQIKIPKPVSEKKKQKLKQSSPTGSAESNCSPLGQQASVRKCLHCEITKTPQWRAGPLGPKTLCNACGVRYKSGRLFPEYRPAASPTFIPSVHSNSHKKVVEMRIKGGDRKFMNAAVPPISCEPDMISNPSLKYM